MMKRSKHTTYINVSKVIKTDFQEKPAREIKSQSIDVLINDSREGLSKICRDLSKEVFPLSNSPKKKYCMQMAHAISAISLGVSILRDIDLEMRAGTLIPFRGLR